MHTSIRERTAVVKVDETKEGLTSKKSIGMIPRVVQQELPRYIAAQAQKKYEVRITQRQTKQ